MAQFSCKTKIISGEGSVSALKSMGIGRLMLVTDPYFVKNGKAGEIMEISGAAEREIFSDSRSPP
jgi:alcohol dehydrogenase class IV